jgi:exopolyphosphatase/guanosine-5'-triphosphate,3'-diphosphate pyrophosphatase
LRAGKVSAEQHLTGVVDIGSNSVRLVVYRGLTRAPLMLFNEKVMCALGKGVGKTGALDPDARALALATIRRFALLCRDMGAHTLQAIATSAVREATDGADFVADVRSACNLVVEVISGEEEARLAALGVSSAIPQANGVVGDLGGGSLELVRLERGAIQDRMSMPLGPFSLLGMKNPTPERLQARIADALEGVAWLKGATGLPFYLVGGAWRALCHLHMHRTHHPLPIIHHYTMPADASGLLAGWVKTLNKRTVKAIPNLAERRLPTLLPAALVLAGVAQRMQPSALIASAHGVREGVIFSKLTPEVQAEDPLIAACRQEARLEGRFPEHGDALMAWMDPLFSSGEAPGDRRLRLATCLLADVAWRGHPDFRPDRALDASLYSNFVGIDPRGRVITGLALAVCYGGSIEGRIKQLADGLLSAREQQMAIAWGQTLRLGQRMTAGTGRPLAATRLAQEKDRLILTVRPSYADLLGEVVERRLAALAQQLGLQPAVRLG